jgi:type I restriction enzyme S subunit
VSEKLQQRLVGDLIRDGVLRVSDGYRAKNSELGAFGVPFARAANVRNGVHLDDAELLVPESVAKAGDKLALPHDVVFTSKGTVGRFALVGADDQQFVYSPQLCFWRVLDRETIDPRFLFFWMHGEECKSQFHALKGQTDMADYISLRDQKLITVSLPDVTEQRRIATVLASLDAATQTQLRMARRLEALIGFQFEQMSARIQRDGRFTEHALGDLGIVKGGGTPKTGVQEYWSPPEVLWVTPTDMSALEMPVVETTSKRISELGLAKSSAKLMPRGTVLMTSRATIGLTGIAATPVSTNQGFISIEPRDGYSSPFVLFAVRSAQEAVHALAGGSTFQEINKTNFKGIPLCIPDDEYLAEFDDFALPAWSMIETSSRTVARLRSIREEVLPDLVAGRLHIAAEYEATAVVKPGAVVGPASPSATDDHHANRVTQVA